MRPVASLVLPGGAVCPSQKTLGGHVRLLLGALSLALAVLAVGWQFREWRPLDPATSPPVRGEPVVDVHRVARDSSSRGNHGVNQGSPEQGLAGRRGTAYSYNSAGSWTQVTSAPELNPGRRDFVISAWVNLRVAPRQQETNDLVRKGLSFTPGGEFKLEIVADGRPKCTIKDVEGREASIMVLDVDVADRRWHRVGCARTGDRLSVILDNTVTDKRIRVGEIRNTMTLSIGSKYGWEDVPDGRIDEVSYYVQRRVETGRTRGRNVAERIERIQTRDNAVGLWRLDETPD